MARKRQRKRSRLRTVVLLLLLPLVIWFLALLIWFNWYDLTGVFRKREIGPANSKPTEQQIDKTDRPERGPASKPQERIFDEDRKQLEEILKRRS